MPRNRKAAALLRAVERKRPDNQVTAALERLLEPLDVGLLYLLVGQEVEGGAIMPDVICICRLPTSMMADDGCAPTSWSNRRD